MRILIVDDETLARDRLLRMLQSDGRHEVIADVSTGAEALEASERLLPDLVLLDSMPGMDGIETAGHFLTQKESPAVIFCTAYEEHAIQAFEMQAVGYLLKPVRKSELMDAIERSTALNRVQLSALQAANDTRRIHLCARTYKGMRLINIKDIRYLQADQKYVTVRDEQQEVIVDETLRELEHEFADVFVRVHRNALISRKHIVGLEKGVTGKIVMRLDGVAETVDISRRHLPAVRKILKNI